MVSHFFIYKLITGCPEKCRWETFSFVPNWKQLCSEATHPNTRFCCVTAHCERVNHLLSWDSFSRGAEAACSFSSHFCIMFFFSCVLLILQSCLTFLIPSLLNGNASHRGPHVRPTGSGFPALGRAEQTALMLAKALKKNNQLENPSLLAKHHAVESQAGNCHREMAKVSSSAPQLPHPTVALTVTSVHGPPWFLKPELKGWHLPRP